MAPLIDTFRDANEQMRVIKTSEKISLISNITLLSYHTDTLEYSSSKDQPNEAKIKEGELDRKFHLPPKPMDDKKH